MMRQVLLLALVASSAAVHFNFEIEMSDAKKGLKSVKDTPAPAPPNPHSECRAHLTEAECNADPGNSFFWTKCQWIVFKKHGVPDPSGRGICEPYHKTPEDVKQVLEYFEGDDKKPDWIKNCLQQDSKDNCEQEDSCQWVWWQENAELKGKCVPGSADETQELKAAEELTRKTAQWVKNCLVQLTQEGCDGEDRCQWVPFGPPGSGGPGKCVPGPKGPVEEFVDSFGKESSKWVKNCLVQTTEDGCEAEARCLWFPFGPPGTGGPGKCVPGPKSPAAADEFLAAKAKKSKKSPKWVKNCLVQHAEEDCMAAKRCQWFPFGPPGTAGPGVCVPGPKTPAEAPVFAAAVAEEPEWVKECLYTNDEDSCDNADKCQWVPFMHEGQPDPQGRGKCVPNDEDMPQILVAMEEKKPAWVKECLEADTQHSCGKTESCQWVPFGPPGSGGPGKCVPWSELRSFMFEVEVGKKKSRCLHASSDKKCNKDTSCKWIPYGPPGTKGPGKCVQWWDN